jgi:hypothetical protein
MIGCDAHVKTTIENPYQIYQDSTHLNRRIVYKPFILPKPFHTEYLRVVVEYRRRFLRGMIGYVVTAFATRNIRKGDILIWEMQ